MCRAALLCLLSGVSLLRAASDSLSAALPVSVSAITVLLDFEQPHSSASFSALQQELGRILKPARLQVDLRVKTEVPSYAQFRELLMFKMKGYCSMGALPLAALSDERGALAMTYSVDGQMLPFGEVECDRVRQSVQRVLGRSTPDAQQSALGVALARVLAHEMYHMIANCADHTSDGVTKKSLSGRDLSQGYLFLPEQATEVLRNRHNQRDPR